MTKRGRHAADRKKREVAAIERRLRDIALGAHGPYRLPALSEKDDNYLGIVYSLGIAGFAQFIGGVQNAFDWSMKDADEESRKRFLTGIHFWSEFDDLATAAEHLWQNGVRA